MIGNYDYNNDEVMKILNNAEYTDEQKKDLFEKYKANLKDLRRKEIINRLNECAKSNPIITQEEYINFLKKYNDDDLSKPFEVIEGELEDFSREMQEKYNAYLRKKEAEKKEQEIPVEDPVFDEPEVEEEPVNYDDEEDDDLTPDITPNNYSELVDALYSNSDEDTKEIKPTVFEDDEEEVKEMMPEDIPESLDEKGNANAVIISIIAIIVGMVIMYSIIKLK